MIGIGQHNAADHDYAFVRDRRPASLQKQEAQLIDVIVLCVYVCGAEG